jgi:hypothetical protein
MCSTPARRAKSEWKPNQPLLDGGSIKLPVSDKDDNDDPSDHESELENSELA